MADNILKFDDNSTEIECSGDSSTESNSKNTEPNHSSGHHHHHSHSQHSSGHYHHHSHSQHSSEHHHQSDSRHSSEHHHHSHSQHSSGHHHQSHSQHSSENNNKKSTSVSSLSAKKRKPLSKRFFKTEKKSQNSVMYVLGHIIVLIIILAIFSWISSIMLGHFFDKPLDTDYYKDSNKYEKKFFDHN